MDIQLYASALLAMMGAGILFWIISLIKQDVSIVDSLWAIFFIIAAWVFIDTESANARDWLILTLVMLWGIRLSAYITLRNLGHPEDTRYREIRERNQPHFAIKSLYLIFIFQALVAWIVSLPLLPALNAVSTFTPFDVIGILLWVTGMFFEATGDQQLRRFKHDPSNRGKVMDRGLWRYTRHPNYFGEFLIWWGYYCFALSNGGWWSIVSPLLMSLLLLKFSGVALLEKTMSQRPGYAEYMRRTNAFFPGPQGDGR